jgi:hypothetical protein
MYKNEGQNASHFFECTFLFKGIDAKYAMSGLDGINSVMQSNECCKHFVQSLVGSVVIDAAFGSEDHGSTPRNCDRKGAGTT